jgi:hypothetical protein
MSSGPPPFLKAATRRNKPVSDISEHISGACDISITTLIFNTAMLHAPIGQQTTERTAFRL